MASITEVARRAGVSITTVSRVLNPVSEYPVAAATRRRVLAAASALQYSPSALARALVTRRSHMFGVLRGDIVDAPTRRALERELAAMAEQGAVALAVAGDHADLPAVDIDHAAGAEDMVRYLVGLGHQRIGFISGPLTVSTSRYRRQGFLKGMATAGLEAQLIIEGDFTYAGGQAAAAQLLPQQPTAIFAANDQMALGALAACRAAGVAVPDEMSVVGFGNTSAAEHAVPALTTVSMPRHQLGVEAMQAVIDALALASETPRVFPRRLPYHLVIRESSGPLSRPQQITARRSRNAAAR